MEAKDTRKAAEGIVASIAAGNTSGALKDLRELTVIPATQFDLFEAQFKSQEPEILRRFGMARDHEFLRADELGTRLIRYQFLVHYARAPMRWVFVFYAAERGWALNDFKFDGLSMDFFNSPNSSQRPQ